MTLKYESEILFDLMKRDGDDAPSDVLPYESELKEKYLNQVEGAYPKLQDYRPEWLYYNLYLRIPSDFPVESVANVTSASFYNVVPYTYKSTILKGQTLVNLSVSSGYKTVTFTPTQTYISDFQHNVEWYKPNTKYLVITEFNHDCKYKFGVNVYDTKSIFNETTYIQEGVGKVYKHILTTKTDFTGCNTTLRTVVYNNTEETDFSQTYRMMIIEYQDGMENWNIPYFEGMQSVKMPVLTTSNEDGTKTNILTVNEDVTLRGIGEVQDTLDCLTGEVTERVGVIVLDGSEDWAVSGYSSSSAFYTPLNNLVRKGDYLNSISCDKLVVHTNQSYLINSTSPNGISAYADWTDEYPNENWLYIKYTDSEGSVDKLKQWLSQNPITVQYELATESIKTVDLSCINEQGKSATFRPIEGTMHVNTSSQTLPPLLDMIVPVEATTQNLMSFANIAEEE